MSKFRGLAAGACTALVLTSSGCSSSGSPANAPSNAAGAQSGASGGPAATGGSSAGVSGSATGSAGSAGSAGAQAVATHVVSPCPVAGTGTGTWENVTPPGLNLAADFKTPAGENFGAHAFVIDPHDNATVYLGSSGQGIFKTTDCGATWVLISRGDVNNGRNGSMVIDPVDPNVLYTDGRYGPVGVFKTTNGGVDWTQILPPEIANVFIYGGMVEWIAMDPTNHLHLTVMPHFNCVGAHAPSCMLETKDGGTAWTVIDNTPDSTELSGDIMLDSKTWLIAQPFGGIWRTEDAGVSWKQVYNGGSAPSLYKAADGTLYMPGSLAGVLRSTDGIQWTPIPSANQSSALAVTKTAFYSDIGLNDSVYFSAPLESPSNWKSIEKVPAPQGNGGWMLGADLDHDLVYSSNFKGGFWRYATKH